MADEKTTFTLNLDGSAGEVAEETANAFEKLRSQMAKSEGAIRQYESQLRRVKGSSQASKDAAEQLRAKIMQEKTAVAAGNIELLKAGVSYDKLAEVPKAKTALNDLAISLDKSTRGTFLQGQVLVDTYNAVAQAQAAAGDETANKVREVLERGKLTGLVGINPMELIGSGIDFGDISSALAGQMHVSVQDAQNALLQGRVKLSDAAEAMRTAVEARFGKLNLAKMLSLDVLEQKFHENLAALPIVIFPAALVSAYDAADKLIKKLDKLPSGVKNAMNPVGTGLDIGKKLGGGVESGLRDAIGWHSPPKLFVDAR